MRGESGRRGDAGEIRYHLGDPCGIAAGFIDAENRRAEEGIGRTGAGSSTPQPQPQPQPWRRFTRRRTDAGADAGTDASTSTGTEW